MSVAERQGLLQDTNSGDYDDDAVPYGDFSESDFPAPPTGASGAASAFPPSYGEAASGGASVSPPTTSGDSQSASGYSGPSYGSYTPPAAAQGNAAAGYPTSSASFNPSGFGTSQPQSASSVPSASAATSSATSATSPSSATPSASASASAASTTATAAAAAAAAATSQPASSATGSTVSSNEALRRASSMLSDDFLRLTVEVPASQMRHQAPHLYHQQQQQHFGGGAPYVLQGMIHANVMQARLAKNYGLTTMDPICRLIVGNASVATAICSNGGKEPRWNQRLEVPVPDGCTTMRVEIISMGTFSDRLVAWGEIELAEVITGTAIEDWFSLSGKQGEDKEGVVHMHLRYDKQPVYAPPVYPPVYPFGGYVPPQQQYYAPPPQQQYYAPPPQQQYQPPAPQPAPQQPAQPPVEVSQADVDQLHEMFPTYDKDTIKSVLQANRGDKDAAVIGLLAT